MTAIDKLIDVAEAEVGYLEKASDSSLYDKTANAGSANYTKYWADIEPDFQGEPWCACFVTWCMVQAFGRAAAKKLLRHYPYISCPAISKLFTLNANPKRGDVVIFFRGGEFAHTGIVTEVYGDYFVTVEGNTSGGSEVIANGGGVCRKGYYNSSLPGTKFCRPDYDILESGELTMTQYEELKQLITGLQTQICALQSHISNIQTGLDGVRSLASMLNASVTELKAPKMIYNYIDDNMPQWAREGVRWCADNGVITGTGDGLGLDDKDIRFCTMLMRAVKGVRLGEE